MKKNRIKKIILTTLAMLPCFNTYSFAAQNSRTVSQRTNSNSKNRRRQNNPENENEKTLSGYAPSDLLSYHKKHGIVSLTKALTKSPKGIPYLGGAGVLGAAGIGVLGFAGYKGGKFIQGKLKKSNPNLDNGNQTVEQNLNTGNPPVNVIPQITGNPLGEEAKLNGELNDVQSTQPNAQKPEVPNVVEPTIAKTNPNPNLDTDANNNKQENQKEMPNNIPLANNIENNNTVKQSWKALFDDLLKEKSGSKVLSPYSNMSNRNIQIDHYKTSALNNNQERHNTINGDQNKSSNIQFNTETAQSFRIKLADGGFFSKNAYDPLFTACKWHEKRKDKHSEVESPIYWFGKFVVFGNKKNDQATLNDQETPAQPLMLSDLKYSLRLLWEKWQKALPSKALEALSSQNKNNMHFVLNTIDAKLGNKLTNALTDLENTQTVESLYKTATEIDKLRLEYNYNLAQSAKTKKEKYNPLTILDHAENLDPNTGFVCLGNKIPNGGKKTFLQVITGSQ